MCSYNIGNDDEESLHPEVTPHINATYLHSNGSFKFPAFPDTGGCLTMISSDLASKKKIHVVTNFNVPKLVAINGKDVQKDGIASLHIQNPHNGISSDVLAIVSPNLKNQLIIGFPQLKKVGVIPENFLFLRFSVHTNVHAEFDKIKNSICNEFPDVIHKKLLSEPMKGQPMLITSSEDAKPTRVYTARQIPKHLQTKADDIVNEMLMKGNNSLCEWTNRMDVSGLLHIQAECC